VQYSARRHARLRAGQSFIAQADGTDAGWVVLAELPDAIQLVEVMLLPELRGKGIGSEVIRGIAAEAKGPLRLTVSRMNPGAIRLYERLGFRRTGEDDVHFFMERSASRSS
jgi:ribosomal protein S18 acetylase RimI-like enzyme